eukprot:TRINITY_DN15694_c0_g1_i1.p1 TRINITY_DN15694_c0_g1~~TRINITY_DN15694_c0_g1_i1.p1  ORF type:complete len:175 (+),score=15.40 TRINITY_DN15694_c0_g1_i1:75-527(+)
MLYLDCENWVDMRFPSEGTNSDLHVFHRSDYGGADFFIASQTLEHLYNPFQALSNIKRHLKPGAYVFASVPTVNLPHSVPHHFFQFEPMGLTMLFLQLDFEITGDWFLGEIEIYDGYVGCEHWPDFQSLLPTTDKKSIYAYCYSVGYLAR